MSSQGPLSPSITSVSSTGKVSWYSESNTLSNNELYAYTGTLSHSSGSTDVISVNLVKGGSAASPAYSITAPLSVTNTGAYISMGSATNLFTATWTASEVNASNFGIGVKFVNSVGTTTETLTCTGFGFSIPLSSTVDGFTVETKGFGPASGTVVPNCVVGGSVVATNLGDVFIESIRIGDLVSSFDEVNNQVVFSSVINVFHLPKEPRKVYSLFTLYMNLPLRVTEDHEILTLRGWVQAKDIQLSDTVRMLHNESTISSPITYIETEILDIPVFNIEIERTHTFFSDGILVHNFPVPGSSNFLSLDHVRVTVYYTGSGSTIPASAISNLAFIF